MWSTIRSCSLLFAISFGFANAAEIAPAVDEEIACTKLANKVPGKLAQARRLAPLKKEIIEPDLDYCHDNLSRCDLRTLVFKNFSIRLLHEKASGRVAFHIAEFSSLKQAKSFCGKECVSAAVRKAAKRYVIDCQASI